MALSQRRRLLIGRLRGRRTRAREGLVLVEGARAASEALDAGATVSFAVVSPMLGASARGGALRQRLAGFDVHEVADEELTALADTRAPQGILLVCAEPGADVERLDGRRFLLLDGVQDPGNVGTLVRGAVAFGLDGVVCMEGTVDPWGAKAVRASAGLVFRAAVAVGPWARAAARMSELGARILVAEAGGVDVRARAPAGSFALVVGNEGAGVRPEIARAGETVAVPMSGAAESLNAGVAGSILMYALSRSEAHG